MTLDASCGQLGPYRAGRDRGCSRPGCCPPLPRPAYASCRRAVGELDGRLGCCRPTSPCRRGRKMETERRAGKSTEDGRWGGRKTENPRWAVKVAVGRVKKAEVDGQFIDKESSER